MKYIVLHNGEWIKNEDGSVLQYDEWDLDTLLKGILMDGELETLHIHAVKGGERNVITQREL